VFLCRLPLRLLSAGLSSLPSAVSRGSFR